MKDLGYAESWEMVFRTKKVKVKKLMTRFGEMRA